MLTLLHRQLEVRIDNDRSFTFGSVDNPHSYERAYRLDDEPYLPTSLHTVTVIQEDGVVISSCILGATGGASGVHEHSAIIHSDSLLIAVGPFIASLQLPSLVLNWKVKTDWATCFGVYHSPENRCYISHGEIDVAAVSYDGVISWANSGADIFTNGFSVSKDEVAAVDWNEDRYLWDIRTGKLIETTANKSVNPSGGSGGPNFPRRFGTKFLLVLTTLAGSVIHVIASSLLQSVNAVAQNLAIFYLNFAVFFVLTAILGSLYRKAGVFVAVLLSLALCSTMLWSICVWEEMYFRYAGIHVLLLLFVAYVFLSICVRSLNDADSNEAVNNSLPRRPTRLLPSRQLLWSRPARRDSPSHVLQVQALDLPNQ